MRADKFFAEKFGSRTKSAEAIEKGLVLVNGKTIKPKIEIKETDVITFVEAQELFVSNGGYKLDRAIKTFDFSPKGLTFADIGASTGGFTDCLLQKGASKVYAIDCGYGQLHPKLLSDERVVNIERFNARELTPSTLGELVDIAVADVSFISQTTLHSAVASVLKKGGMFVTLIKPQFEAGKQYVKKGGIVKDRSVYPSVIEKVKLSCASNGMAFVKVTESPVKGGDGNTEFIAYFLKE